MAQLSRKGIKKPQFETPMTVEEELAAPLIRSIEVKQLITLSCNYAVIIYYLY